MDAVSVVTGPITTGLGLGAAGTLLVGVRQK